MPAITPCLWFEREAEEAVRFYTSIFPNSSIDGMSHYGEGAPLPAGTPLMIAFTLDGQSYQALNGGMDFPFTEAVSFSIDCADQAEVDRYWGALRADGGKPVQCGWLKDKYGLSWQIVPQVLIRLQQEGTPEQVGRMFAAMMPMVKLDAAALEAAFYGEDR